MGDLALDPLIHSLWAIVVPIAIVCMLAGTLVGVAVKWLARNAKGGGEGTDKRRTSSTHLPPLPKVVLPRRRQETVGAADAATLDMIGWENFELLAGEILRRQGYEVEITSGLGADGGKDLTVRRNGETRLVQCKNLRAGNKVAAAAMRDFYGLVVSEGVSGGIFMTTGAYSRDAAEFAAGKPIELLGRADVERLITSLAQPGENLCDVSSWIEGFTAAARVTDPSCQFCRKPMKLRRGPTGSVFWGCTGYASHRCRGKRDAREELVSERYQRV